MTIAIRYELTKPINKEEFWEVMQHLEKSIEECGISSLMWGHTHNLPLDQMDENLKFIEVNFKDQTMSDEQVVEKIRNSDISKYGVIIKENYTSQIKFNNKQFEIKLKFLYKDLVIEKEGAVSTTEPFHSSDPLKWDKDHLAIMFAAKTYGKWLELVNQIKIKLIGYSMPPIIHRGNLVGFQFYEFQCRFEKAYKEYKLDLSAEDLLLGPKR